MTAVLIVDDHASFRQPLAFMLDREPDLAVVGQAGTLAEARGMLAGVDIAVVDLGLPDGSGVDLVRSLHDASPDAQALILSAATDRQLIARAIEAGAAGVLHKSAGIGEIVAAVRRLAAGQQLLTTREIVALLELAGQQRMQQREVLAALARLTPRELDVLQALADGLNDREIAQRLHIATETARTHMVNILRKLGVDSRLQALVFAVRHGVVEIR